MVKPLNDKNDNSRTLLGMLTLNIQEGFCDGLSSHLAQFKYPDLNISDRYHKVRDDILPNNSKDYIEQYDLGVVFSKIRHKKSESNIKSIDDILNIAIENTFSILIERLNVEYIKDELSTELKQRLPNKNLILETSEDFINVLRQELFTHNPPNINNKQQLISNMFDIRNKYSNNNSINSIKNNL